MEITEEKSAAGADAYILKLHELPVDILEKIELNGFDLICINDFTGKISYVSESVKKLLGYTKGELTGRSIFRFIMREDLENLMAFINHPSSSQHKWHIHLRNHMGKFIIFETIVQIIEINGKKQVLSLCYDISDKKQAEEMLIRSEKMTIAGQLSAGIAHEIRNPLTSLKGFIQLLQAGMENKKEYYKIMMDEIEKINTITSELLFVSKPMTDEKRLENVTDLLKDVITLLNTQAKLFDIELSLSIKDNISLYCDRSQLKQVFINLIKNAIEEMPDGGKVEVLVERKDKSCTISFIDQGPGIPDHLVNKLKEPFYTTKKSGTGLGLMICNQIIHNHDGYLDIESVEGSGSVFRIYLPHYTSE